jgi:hypothetical protein
MLLGICNQLVGSMMVVGEYADSPFQRYVSACDPGIENNLRRQCLDVLCCLLQALILPLLRSL